MASSKARVLIDLELVESPENNKDIAMLFSYKIEGSKFECERMFAAALKERPQILRLISNAINMIDSIDNIRQITLPKDL